MPSILALSGPSLGQLPNGKSQGMTPAMFDPEQLAIGTRVEMEHTIDPYIAQRIAMDHLAEDPAYYRKLRAVHLDGSVPRRGLAWLLASVAGIGIGFIAWKAAQKRIPELRGPQMLKVIAREAKTPEEYARRADAWNAGEGKPLPVSKLVAAYKGRDKGKLARLLREAAETRLEQRERLWSRMSKGLRGKLGSVAGYRVAYGTSDARGVFRAFDDRVLSTVEQATKLMRSYKRQGFWTWVEDEQGNFVPVPGAKSERARKAYPLR